jgi:hypothetical protein
VAPPKEPPPKVKVAPGAKPNKVVAKPGPRPLTRLTKLPHHHSPSSELTKYAPNFQAHKPLQEAFDDELKKRNVESKAAKPSVDLFKVAHALVDLTADADKPRLAGHGLDTQRAPASCAKLACLLAAHQLSFDLRILAKKTPGVTTQEALFALARRTWSETQVAGKLVHFGKSDVVARKWGAPNLEAIFAAGWPFPDPDAAGPGFKDTGLGFPDLIQFEYPGDFAGYAGRLKRLPGEHGGVEALATVGFQERLELMIGQSLNSATGTCVRDVGYLYLASVLLRTGLYDPARGGLWLGASYIDKDVPFVPDPVHGKYVTATPRALATWFTLLARDELVDFEATGAMLPLLHKVGYPAGEAKDVMEWPAGGGTRSYFKGGVPTTPEPTVYSKLGILDQDDPLGYSDAAWIKRKPAGKKRENSFVLVGLQTSATALKRIAEAASAAVEATNS